MARDWAELGQRVMELTETLVAQPSVCRWKGEAEIIEYLEGWLRECLATQLGDGRAELHTVEFERPALPAPAGDGLPGKALLAWLAPAAGTESTKALALMGHCDTVGVSIAGTRLAASAGSTGGRPSAAANPRIGQGNEERRPGTAALPKDASGSPSATDGGGSPPPLGAWQHGRGWLDMKGGVAAITELFLAHARANAGEPTPVEPLPAHLLLLLTTDEEDSSLGAYALLPVLNALRERRKLKLECIVNADYCEPPARDNLQGTVYCGTAGKLLLGISVFGQPAHACAAGEGVNAATLAAHIAAGIEDLPRLAVQAGAQRLPPPRVLQARGQQPAYDVTIPEQATLLVNLLHDGRDLPALWKKCLREARTLAHGYQVQQRRRMLAWAQRAREQTLPPAPQRALVTDYAALLKAAQACGYEEGQAELYAGEDPRQKGLGHVAALVSWIRIVFPYDSQVAHEVCPQPPAGSPLAQQIASGRPLIVLSLLPPFYPGGGMPPDSPQRAALGRAAAAHGARRLPLYPNISDLSAFSWTEPNLALAEQAPLFPVAAAFQPPDSGTATRVSPLPGMAVPVCNIGSIGYGAHTPDERVYVPYLRDTLPRLLDSALRELAAIG